MKILRIEIYQPQAHFRIPFTYKRRHSFPIPPYSTVIGYIINCLGLINQNSIEYKNLKKTKISVCGEFENKTTEYVWFRNLNSKRHKESFGSKQNRSINSSINHPGGQTPMKLDTLNELNLIIYLANQDGKFLSKIKEKLINPINRLGPIHLGRAEDWIVLKSEPVFLNNNGIISKRRDANYNHFFWIPEKFWLKENDRWYLKDFNPFQGLLYNISTFATIENYDKTFNHNGKRTFEYISTKLNDGLITNEKVLLDTELKLPIFLGELNGSN